MEIILYLIVCVIVGVVAHDKNRSGIGYFFLSVLLSPIVGFILILVMGKKE